MSQTDTFEQQLEHATEHAPAWRFERDGATIIGEVVGFSEYDAGWGPYPILTLRLSDGSERAVHAQREVLQQELAKARPCVGERLGIKYLGQPEGKKYHRYLVRVDRPEGATFDWGRYVEGAPEEPPAVAESPRAPAPAAAAAPVGDPGPTEPAAGAGDEDIPF
jgi:hypothetical protein